jgi:hypothetical protein
LKQPVAAAHAQNDPAHIVLPVDEEPYSAPDASTGTVKQSAALTKCQLSAGIKTPDWEEWAKQRG